MLGVQERLEEVTGRPSELQQNKLWVQRWGFKEGPHFLHSPGRKCHLEELVKYRPSPRPPEPESPENGYSDLLLLSYRNSGNTVLDSRRNFPHRDEPGEEGESTLGAPEQ